MPAQRLGVLPPVPRGREGWSVLVEGPAHVFRFAHELLAFQLAHGRPCVVLDGANRCDPYALARVARREGADAGAWLGALKVSRAWTCYQYTSLVGQAAGLSWTRETLLVLLGPLDLYMDEEVNARDAWGAWRTCRETLAKFVERHSVVMASYAAERFPLGRQGWWTTLASLADERWRVLPGGREVSAPARERLSAPGRI